MQDEMTATIAAEEQVDQRRAEALRRVMDLFWHRGAETTSYAQIVAETGLSRKALYGYWPDKDVLVAETIALYRREILGMVLAPLSLGGAHGLRTMWTSLEEASKSLDWRGCFLFKTAAGPMRGDRFVAETLAQYIDVLSSEISLAVAEGQSARQLVETVNADHAGWQSVSFNALISTIGAQNGYNDTVRLLYAKARASCGLAD